MGWRSALRTFRGLPRDEALFVARVGLVSALVPAGLAGSLRRAVDRTALPGSGLPVPEPARQVELVDRVLAVDRGPFRPNCVRRSLVLARYLRRAGQDPEICFGVKPEARPEGRFDGHAWLELDGEPLAEREDPRPRYRVMFRGRARSPAARAFAAVEQGVRMVRRRSPRPVSHGLVTLQSALGLGLLSARDLSDVDRLAYEGWYAYHADASHNRRGLFDWEAAAIQRWFPADGDLLITSVGAGREALALREQYDVVASECNERLRALAELALGDRVVPARRDHAPCVGRRFPAAIVGWTAYTFIRGRERRVAFLRELGTDLESGAPVLLSFYARTVETRRMRWIAGGANLVARVLEREPVEVGDVLDPSFQHYHRREELEEELRLAGYELLCFETEPFAHAVVRFLGDGQGQSSRV